MRDRSWPASLVVMAVAVTERSVTLRAVERIHELERRGWQRQQRLVRPCLARDAAHRSPWERVPRAGSRRRSRTRDIAAGSEVSVDVPTHDHKRPRQERLPQSSPPTDITIVALYGQG